MASYYYTIYNNYFHFFLFNYFMFLSYLILIFNLFSGKTKELLFSGSKQFWKSNNSKATTLKFTLNVDENLQSQHNQDTVLNINVHQQKSITNYFTSQLPLQSLSHAIRPSSSPAAVTFLSRVPTLCGSVQRQLTLDNNCGLGGAFVPAKDTQPANSMVHSNSLNFCLYLLAWCFNTY